jgi:hypothetical protein
VCLQDGICPVYSETTIARYDRYRKAPWPARCGRTGSLSDQKKAATVTAHMTSTTTSRA